MLQGVGRGGWSQCRSGARNVVSAVSLCPGAEAVKPRLGRDRDHGVAVAGGIEVGVDLPQSRELKPCPQLAEVLRQCEALVVSDGS